MLKPVYALIGDDAFLQQAALQSLLEDAPSDVLRVELDGERAELAEVLDEVRSFALFGGSKVVIVRSADPFISKYRSQLEDYVASPSDSVTLILRVESLPANQRIYKLIQQRGGIQKCEPPKDLAGWIVTQAKSVHNLAVAPDAARMLADLIGSDLGRIDNELARLALQSTTGKIDVSAVSGSVAFQREQKMWDMTGELAAGRTQQALKRWRQLVRMDSSAEYRAVTWLTMWLENVRKALEMQQAGMAPGAIAQQLKIWPRERQQPFFQTANALGLSGVRRGLELLATIDRQNKSGVGDPVTNVERFIVSMAIR